MLARNPTLFCGTWWHLFFGFNSKQMPGGRETANFRQCQRIGRIFYLVVNVRAWGAGAGARAIPSSIYAGRGKIQPVNCCKRPVKSCKGKEWAAHAAERRGGVTTLSQEPRASEAVVTTEPWCRGKNQALRSFRKRGAWFLLPAGVPPAGGCVGHVVGTMAG